MRQRERRLRLDRGYRHIAAGVLCLLAGAAAVVLPCERLFAGLGLLLLTLFAAAGVFLLVVGAKLSQSSRRSLAALEPLGGLSAAARDYALPTTVCIDKRGRAAFGRQFIFALDSGNICTYAETGWAYISVSRKDGIPTAQVLTLHLRDGHCVKLAAEKPDKEGTAKLLRYLELIKARSPDCLIGYSRENAALWKERCESAGEKPSYK